MSTVKVSKRWSEADEARYDEERRHPRRCAICGAILSFYNTGDKCFRHTTRKFVLTDGKPMQVLSLHYAGIRGASL